MRWAPRTLRARVTIATALVLAVVLSLVAWFVEVEIERSAVRSLDDALQVSVEAVADVVRIEGDRLGLDTDGQEVPGRFSVPKGGIYYQATSLGRAPLRSPSLLKASLEAPPAGDLGPVSGPLAPRIQRRSTRGPFEPKVRVVSLRVSLPQFVEGEHEVRPGAPLEAVIVQVARSTADVERSLAASRRALAIALPAGLLLGALGAFLLARRATWPIERLSQQARSIGASSADVRLDLASVEGELRDLADTLNQAFGRLSEAAARERRFAADASHELRTPLAVLRSRLEVTLSRGRTEEEYRAALSTALDAGLRLEQVVRALLHLSRSDSATARTERVDLRSVVERAILPLRPRAEEAGVSIDVALPDSRIEVLGDAPLLERMVCDLVENAATHGAAGGSVEVRLESAGRVARLLVLDRGPGFAEDLLPRLFERFARGDASRARATGGAGLGMAIARSVARLHGGEVLAGPREGGGVRVEVTLPLPEPAAPKSPQLVGTAQPG